MIINNNINFNILYANKKHITQNSNAEKSKVNNTYFKNNNTSQNHYIPTLSMRHFVSFSRMNHIENPIFNNQNQISQQNPINENIVKLTKHIPTEIKPDSIVIVGKEPEEALNLQKIIADSKQELDNGKSVTIGRNYVETKYNQTSSSNSSISREHFILSRNGNKYFITDISTFGTKITNNTITELIPNEKTELSLNAVILIGVNPVQAVTIPKIISHFSNTLDQEGSINIGRQYITTIENNGVENKSISRNHFTLSKENNKYFITDTSTFGTKILNIAGESLPHNKPTEINPNSIVLVGISPQESINLREIISEYENQIDNGAQINIGKKNILKYTKNNNINSSISSYQFTFFKKDNKYYIVDTSKFGTRIIDNNDIKNKYSLPCPIQKINNAQNDIINQLKDFQTNHKLTATEIILDGYMDGGDSMKIDDNGNTTNASGEIIVIDRKKDKVLSNMINEIKKYTENMDEENKANFIFNYIIENCGNTNTQKIKKWKELNQNQKILLGDIISYDQSVCDYRHKNLLFKILGNEVGLNVELQLGKIATNKKYDNITWNVVTFTNGKIYIYDTTNKNIIPIEDASRKSTINYKSIDNIPIYNTKNPEILNEFFPGISEIYAAYNRDLKSKYDYTHIGVFNNFIPNPSICAWKMHVFSDTVADYRMLADVIIPYLTKNEITHKVLSTVKSPEMLSDGQRGKTFTIFPNSISQMAIIAKDLDALIKKYNLTRVNSQILGDAEMGDSGRLFYRYTYYSKKYKDLILDISIPKNYKKYKNLYKANNDEHNYLSNDMNITDDPWRNFNPADPNSEPEI